MNSVFYLIALNLEQNANEVSFQFKDKVNENGSLEIKWEITFAILISKTESGCSLTNSQYCLGFASEDFI